MRKIRVADWGVIILISMIGLALVLYLSSGTLGKFFGRAKLEDIPYSQARNYVAQLQVRGKQHTPKYARAAYGQAWADVDRNGCDTRNDILGRDMTAVRFKNGNCKVASGELNDPYTGKKIHFKRGAETSPAVQIDHVVALADAWRSGAWQWDLNKREQFANDPMNLLAVDGPANQDKGSKSADQWLPPNEDYQCAYVARQAKVKARWVLTVTTQEKQAIINTLAHCPAMD
ncbi:HNH endonuclease family protein [Gleimia hominis]|uniref:HNH endonuclease family protein n=1 Tax=Gleimia hominis TaxID=595468 RepID=A0ABU3I908_9ACTO|nr:HNH endonuclease family protein [Gleimia hominis]MDT3766858.1 HNH endonuclease family protein [Gleimia hominis]